MKIYNLDRHSVMIGGPVGQPHDRAQVVSETETVPNILTGKPQAKELYRGTLEGAHEFVRKNKDKED